MLGPLVHLECVCRDAAWGGSLPSSLWWERRPRHPSKPALAGEGGPLPLQTPCSFGLAFQEVQPPQLKPHCRCMWNKLRGHRPHLLKFLWSPCGRRPGVKGPFPASGLLSARRDSGRCSAHRQGPPVLAYGHSSAVPFRLPRILSAGWSSLGECQRWSHQWRCIPGCPTSCDKLQGLWMVKFCPGPWPQSSRLMAWLDSCPARGCLVREGPHEGGCLSHVHVPGGPWGTFAQILGVPDPHPPPTSWW